MCVCVQALSVALCFTLVSKMQTLIGLRYSSFDLESLSGFFCMAWVDLLLHVHRRQPILALALPFPMPCGGTCKLCIGTATATWLGGLSKLKIGFALTFGVERG